MPTRVRRKRGFDRLLRTLFEHFESGVFPDHLQLIYGCGTVNIACDEQRLFALFFKQCAELAAHRGLARALQTAHHDYRGRLGRHVELGVLRAHKLDKFVVDNLYDLLTGRDAFGYFLALCPFAYPGDKVLDHIEIDVGFEQRDSYFAHRLLDFVLVEFSPACQLGKYVFEFVS